jgi:hypothetical protein
MQAPAGSTVEPPRAVDSAATAAAVWLRRDAQEDHARELDSLTLHLLSTYGC